MDINQLTRFHIPEYCNLRCYYFYRIYAGYFQLYPERNHVSREYSVAAILNLQFVLHVMLFRP